MILSILIPTLPARQPLLDRLLARLDPQLNESVEVLIDDDKVLPTGEKRNRLVDRATGDYVVHLDDDDLVPEDYVDTVVHALVMDDPDCIGYWSARTVDGVPDGLMHYSTRWRTNGTQIIDGQPVRTRMIMHICPHRRSIATKVPYKPITIGEDVRWARQVRPHFKNETFIDRVMYEYQYITNEKRLENLTG